jgi:5'-deoxynucleotidase YfbR-like HD superfamily hydrolase
MELGNLLMPGDAPEAPVADMPVPAPAGEGKASKMLDALKEFADEDLIAELKARGFEIEESSDEDGAAPGASGSASYFDTAAGPTA